MTKSVAQATYEEYRPSGVDQGCFEHIHHGRVLEIGFGSGSLLQSLQEAGNEVHGVDAGRDIVDRARSRGFNVSLIDVSEQDLPYETDFFDAVYSYETFEHLTNPHRMVSEVRRVLKPGGAFYFSVPTQEGTMGYGACRHAFVYPGLLEKKNLERFLMQMYFRVDKQYEMNTGLIVHRFYGLTNGKREDLPDIMDVIVGDYRVSELYKHVLTPESLQEEVQIEIDGYMKGIVWCLDRPDGLEYAIGIGDHLCESYKGFPSLYMQLFECFFERGKPEAGISFLEKMLADCQLPQSSRERTRGLIASLGSAPALA
ncbi:class I SAM-dependent methyltransferase [Nitrospina sp. 32_T5]|uniref:class I SAM-dependent methyltransferase n=1 Tax=unclassified Nitrospina TaxID=2638683 RepID=UPI003F986C41